MKKILVIADSHGAKQLVSKAIAEAGECDMLIHLGDHCGDTVDCGFSGEIVTVRGNCDTDQDVPISELVNIGGKRIFITHGNKFLVKLDMTRLNLAAREYNCDAALFGHTHCAYKEYENNILMFNPGSLALPNTGGKSYGILEISENGIEAKIVALGGSGR